MWSHLITIRSINLLVGCIHNVLHVVHFKNTSNPWPPQYQRNALLTELNEATHWERGLKKNQGFTGLNPVEALNIFQASSFQLLKLEIYCDDHSLILSTPAVQNMNYFIYTTHQTAESEHTCINSIYHFWFSRHAQPLEGKTDSAYCTILPAFKLSRTSKQTQWTISPRRWWADNVCEAFTILWSVA